MRKLKITPALVATVVAVVAGIATTVGVLTQVLAGNGPVVVDIIVPEPTPTPDIRLSPKHQLLVGVADHYQADTVLWFKLVHPDGRLGYSPSGNYIIEDAVVAGHMPPAVIGSTSRVAWFNTILEQAEREGFVRLIRSEQPNWVQGIMDSLRSQVSYICPGRIDGVMIANIRMDFSEVILIEKDRLDFLCNAADKLARILVEEQG